MEQCETKADERFFGVGKGKTEWRHALRRCGRTRSGFMSACQRNDRLESSKCKNAAEGSGKHLRSYNYHHLHRKAGGQGEAAGETARSGMLQYGYGITVISRVYRQKERGHSSTGREGSRCGVPAREEHKYAKTLFGRQGFSNCKAMSKDSCCPSTCNTIHGEE